MPAPRFGAPHQPSTADQPVPMPRTWWPRHVVATVLACLGLAVLPVPPVRAAPGEQPYAETRPTSGRWPLSPPEVADTFDPPEDAWDSGHRGVDLVGTVGQPVHAALDGEVSFVGRIAGVGIVVVSHGETRTTYQPVEPLVARGTRVSAGDVLGTLAWLGSHCVPRVCLHWGWVRGATYLDPLDLVGGGPRPVRLLPSDEEVAAGVPPVPAVPLIGPLRVPSAVLDRHLLDVP